MKIPKKMKLTQRVYSFLGDSAGLILGEFEVDMSIDPEAMQSTFSIDVNYPGHDGALVVEPPANAARASTMAMAGTETYPIRFVIEALEDPRNMIHAYAYPQIDIPEDRYAEGCVLLSRMNLRTAWGSSQIYVGEGQAGIQWKLGMNFEGSEASNAQLHNMVASCALNVSGWWPQYLALANTKKTAEQIMTEHDRNS